MKDWDQKWQLFWCRLLYPVIYEELEGSGITDYLRGLSKKEVLFPDGKRRKPSMSTLWRKVRAYRKEGTQGFVKKRRKDRGEIRVVAKEVLEKAIEIKKDLPSRSEPTINAFLKEYYGVTLSKSTLYRHLKLAGATRLKLGVNKKKVRCRFSRDHSNSFWTGDFMHGPFVLMDGEAHQTYLSAFIDAHSRLIVDGRYYLRQNKPVLIDCLLRAFAIHGAPRMLYVDNAKVYYAQELELACYDLKIKLLHRPPREPETGGIIERFFGTVQSQFEEEVRSGEILSLDRLNRAFSAWLNVAYHQNIHSETDQSPKERYESGLLAPVQGISLETTIRFFMRKEKRKVHSDFSDISLKGRLYKVDPRHRGDSVVVRYDEFGPIKEVLIYSLSEEYLGKGVLHQRERRDQPQPDHQQGKPEHDYLGLLVDQHDSLLNKAARGIDYIKAVSKNKWPFIRFIATLADLLGRKGGASAFSTGEIEALQKVYQRLDELSESLLMEAAQIAEQKNIPHIIYHLQLLQERS